MIAFVAVAIRLVSKFQLVAAPPRTDGTSSQATPSGASPPSSQKRYVMHDMPPNAPKDRPTCVEPAALSDRIDALSKQVLCTLFVYTASGPIDCRNRATIIT